ncbi:RNA polymerase I specific transcription initiation factor RRN3 protein [Raphanus sativus]|nr:RNA polymerase I specific transcription initiation factor RRN3 protein [Raphanus sativus]
MRAAEEVSSGYDVELRDTAVVSDIREALASAQSTLLKFLSRSVTCLDEVHHEQLLIRILGMRIWDHDPNVVYALLNLIISLATTSGKYLNCCLEMLIYNLLSQPRILNHKMREVLSSVYAALHEISYLVPHAPSQLPSILVKRMPNIYNKGHGLVTYVDTSLKLENSSIGKVVGDRILRVIMQRLLDLDECNPYVVSEFLKQAKAGGLFIVSEAFLFDDLPDSEPSRAFGGFFTFDPCLLKISNSFISPNIIYWSMVKKTYDEDDEDEVIVYGDTDSEDCDDDVVLDNEVSKMSITPKHSFMRETWRLLNMPSRIRPSTSPR